LLTRSGKCDKQQSAFFSIWEGITRGHRKLKDRVIADCAWESVDTAGEAYNNYVISF
jgi:hypothetical protein